MTHTKSYKDICKTFQWENVFASFDWNPMEHVNMAHEICDRYANEKNRIAVSWIGKNWESKEYTFAELKELSDRFANVLSSLGVKKGDRVGGYLPKVPELLITILGTLKLGAVYVPLFTAFGPNAVQYRLNHCQAKLVVTSSQYYPNVIASTLPNLQNIINIDRTNKDSSKHNLAFWEEMEKADSKFSIQKMKFDELAIIQYTSGSTGMPKGAMWSSKILSIVHPYLEFGVGIEHKQVLWGPADPAWAYGLIASILGPLFMGAKIIFCDIPFSPEPYYKIMEKYKVEHFLYAPAAYRAFMAEGDELRNKYEINLKSASSGGEPLSSEVINWFESNFGTKIYDGYGTSETSMLVANLNISSMKVKPGSMGLPLPGFQVDLFDESGSTVPAGEVGQICYNTENPSTPFLGYLNEPEKTKERFINRSWYMTGDLAVKDEDGYFFFQGRDDDIIKSSGYRIGPYEIESTLEEHASVSEAAVVGVPDVKKGNAIVAYVVLKPTYKRSAELAEELTLFVKNKLAKHQTPKAIEFLDTLPRNASGKILRYELRAKDRP